MDVNELLHSDSTEAGALLHLTGWLVDTQYGLFLLGDHFPPEYDYKYRIKIINQNIMYPIMKKVALLGGGKSVLFYRSRVIAEFVNNNDGIIAREISIEDRRGSGEFLSVDISENIVSQFVSERGPYKFGPRSAHPRDWLDDV